MLNWSPAEQRRQAVEVASLPQHIELARILPFTIGPLQLHPSTLQANACGVQRTVEPRVMQALVALAAAERAVISRDRLIDLCWNGRAVSEDAINRCIAKARRLGRESGAFRIETIRRVGYRLVALENGRTPRIDAAHRPAARRISAVMFLTVAFGLGVLSAGSLETVSVCHSRALSS